MEAWRTLITNSASRVIFAYDKATFNEEDRNFLNALLPHLFAVKTGIIASRGFDEFGIATEWRVAERARSFGKVTMEDLKYHDVLTTVKTAITASTAILESMRKIITIHGLTRLDTVAAACEAAGECLPTFISVLTDHGFTDEGIDECRRIYGDNVGVKVREAAENALYGADVAKREEVGLVCSPADLEFLNEHMRAGDLKRLIKITPSIRPLGSDAKGQKRHVTPTQAIRAGSDLLVIGSPIQDVASLHRINEEVATALA